VDRFGFGFPRATAKLRHATGAKIRKEESSDVGLKDEEKQPKGLDLEPKITRTLSSTQTT